MKRLINKKAFTLIETVIAIVIIAVVALPLLSVFLQSIKTDQAAKTVLNANYISQDYIEKLDATTYPNALANLPNRVTIEDYYLTADIKPYGTTNSLFGCVCEYAHMIFYSDNSMLTVLPDGDYLFFSSVPNYMSLSITTGSYTFIYDGITVTGDTDYVYCALLINGMQKQDCVTSNITLGSTCKSVLYCKDEQKDDIIITGTNETYSDMITGETSLINVTTYVYDSYGSTLPKGVSESYINIKNW